ncbi:MAG: response regulator [Planctomycetaceae bacterium]|nr:response regulator [Planctomycetaceae bacterium]
MLFPAYIHPFTLFSIGVSAVLMFWLTAAACRRGKRTLFLAVSWCMFCTIIPLGLWGIDHTVQIAKNDRRNMLSDLAKSFAVTLREAGHENIPADADAENPHYKHCLNILTQMQDRLPITASIYTLRKNKENRLVFICCPPADLNRDNRIEGEKEQLVPLGTIYPGPPEDVPELMSAADGLSGFNGEVVEDEWGRWVTAAEPIYDKTGKKVDAVLGVDFWGEVWDNEIAGAAVWPQLFLLLFLILFFIVVVFLYHRRTIEDQLTQYAASLEQTVDELVVAKKNTDIAIQAKGYFLANMSHEIRTPMHAILGCVDMLADLGQGKKTTLPQEQVIDLIRKSSKDLMTVIDDMLTFSDIDSHRVVLETVPVNLRQLIEDVKTLLQDQLQTKHRVNFSFLCEDNVPQAFIGDPVRLRWILISLLNNAVKFTESGRISIRCSCLPQKAAETNSIAALNRNTAAAFRHRLPESPQTLRARGLRGTVLSTLEDFTAPPSVADIKPAESGIADASGAVILQIDVTDTGIGLSEEQIDGLFKPFSQADATSTRKYGGTGLGLGIVKGLVQLMEGTIAVKSTPGAGSTFSVLIPVYEPEHYAYRKVRTGVFLPPNVPEPKKPVSSAAKPLPLSDLRILVVDDAVVNQLVAEAKLKDAGAVVENASNGQTALDKVREAELSNLPFDLILMDLQMPVMDGFTATRQLRQRGFAKPIVALTANYGSSGMALEAGCNRVLSKPIDRDLLINTILELSSE